MVERRSAVGGARVRRDRDSRRARPARRVAFTVGMLIGIAGSARAQESFVAGSAGVGIGEGTSAEFTVSAGYLMSKRFGLELEFSGRPDIEFPIRPVPVIQNPLIPPIFPGFQIEMSGHLLSFH